MKVNYHMNERFGGILNINTEKELAIGTWNVGKALRRVSVEQYRHLINCCQILGLTEIGVKSSANFEEVINSQMFEAFKWFVKPRIRRITIQ